MIELGFVLPDIHTPLHDEKAVSAVLKCVKRHKPKFLIQLGDLGDFDSISRFGKKRKDHIKHSLQDELDATKQMFDRIEDALPKGCKKVFIEGNHEIRLRDFDINSLTGKEKKLIGRSSLNGIEEEMQLAKRGWEFVRYKDVYSKGKALFTHGWFVNQYHASKTVKKWFETVIYGHTHQYQVHTVVGRNRHPVAGISIGTLSRFDLDYVATNPDWTTMFAPMEYYGSRGHFQITPTPIIDGKFCFQGEIYG